MDLGNENVRVRIDGDRISSLPDEIIHHILSFNDTKYAVQTSVLSSRWKLVWTTLPYLKFSSGQFRILPKFSKFVNRVLSRRNNLTEVSTVDLYFRGRYNQKFVQNIANYAVSHNVQKVNIFACEHNVKENHQFPLCLFSSQSLKHLSLKINPLVTHILPLPQLPWVSPALTTIELDDVMLCAVSTTCLDLFSMCVSLMNLTLIRCCGNGLEVMKILCPRLVHLTISCCWLTKYEVVAPNLSSFCYEANEGSNPLFLYTGGLNSLDKVNMRLTINSVNLNENKQTIAHEFMNLLHELRNAKFVTLYGPFIEFLSLVLDLQEHQPSPFCNLKCLSIKEVEKRRKRTKSDKTNQVITYLLNSSPTATVNIEFQKRKQDDNNIVAAEGVQQTTNQLVEALLTKNDLLQKRNDLQEQRHEFKIMMKDINSITDPDTRAYIQSERARILQKRVEQQLMQPNPDAFGQYFQNIGPSGTDLSDY